jgi:hypothetical protein
MGWRLKILLDENVEVAFKTYFLDRTIFTVRELGWNGRKNGVLLRSMRDEGFEILITLDQHLPHQQNLSKLKIGVIVLLVKDARLPTLIALRSLVENALDKIAVGQSIVIDGRDLDVSTSSPPTDLPPSTDDVSR